MTDQDHALKIESCMKALNAAIDEAVSVGLTVELSIESRTRQEMTKRPRSVEFVKYSVSRLVQNG